jgi:glycosyltransferase involved in cell wall biosynthesis
MLDSKPHTPALLVFADDWGRHPSSCQHLIRHLVGRREVYWINTIGTREPRLNLATLRRGLEKISNWIRRPLVGSDPLPANLRVLNPKMWPWSSHRFDQGLNRELLFRQLAPLVRSLPAPPIAVTTLPIVSDLMGLLPVQRWVYYCVDDFGEWPGLAQAALRQMEERVIRRADSLVAVSETLQEKVAQRGRQAQLLTHGIEPDFWKIGPARPLPQLKSMPRPLVVFWGVIDRRMDVAFVRHLAAELERGTVVLVGRQDDPDPALFAIPRVVHVPALPFTDLPHLAAAASVLIMPYADLPVTRAMQPLKLKEYLATGRPVVVRDLPANRSWSDCMDLAATPMEFTRLVRLRLEQGLPANQGESRCRLAGETWAEKARCFENWSLAT